ENSGDNPERVGQRARYVGRKWGTCCSRGIGGGRSRRTRRLTCRPHGFTTAPAESHSLSYRCTTASTERHFSTSSAFYFFRRFAPLTSLGSGTLHTEPGGSPPALHIKAPKPALVLPLAWVEGRSHLLLHFFVRASS